MLKPLSLSPPSLYCAGSRVWQQQFQKQAQQQTRCFKKRKTSDNTSHVEIKKMTNRIPLEDLRSVDLGAYWDTQPPMRSDLQAARRLFAPSDHSPVKLFSAAHFRSMPQDSKEPEVAFLGRSNVGKSSLINAILGKDICYSSKTPGRTKIMNAFGIGGTKGGESKIVLLDMPGYGRASNTMQGMEIMKYLQNRKQLRRTYVLIDPLHGLKDTDKQMLSLLRQHAIPHQIILSKVDRIIADKVTKTKNLHTLQAVRSSRIRGLQNLFATIKPLIQPDPATAEGPGALGEILSSCAATNVSPGVEKSYINIDAVRWSIMKATGFDGTIVQPPVISDGDKYVAKDPSLPREAEKEGENQTA